MPVLVIPLLTSIVAGILMIIVLGKPIGWLMDQLTDGLNSLSGGYADPARRHPRPDDGLRHGRPAQQGRLQLRRRRRRWRPRLASDAPELKIMAAVMLAGMVPPIALALATVVRPGLFNVARARERQGRLAARRLVHHRGRDPVRRGRPAAGDPRDHARLGGHRRPLDGPGRRRPRPARRHLRALRRRQHPRLPHRPGRRRRRRRDRRDRRSSPSAASRRPTPPTERELVTV